MSKYSVESTLPEKQTRKFINERMCTRLRKAEVFCIALLRKRMHTPHPAVITATAIGRVDWILVWGLCICWYRNSEIRAIYHFS
jgi:hypothetical protein